MAFWDYWDSEEWFMAGGITLGTIAVLGLLGWGGWAIHRSIDVDNSKLKIEENVVKHNELAKFTGNAYTVSAQDNEYFLELFGIAIKTPGATPSFTSLTYKIDEDLYNKIFKYVDIKYEYGREGQVIGAENNLRENLRFFFPGEGARNAEYDIFRQMVKVTAKQAESINELGPSKETTQKTAAYAGEEGLGITNISKPVIDKENQTVSFFIQAVTDVDVNEQDQGELSVKTFKVSQKLTAENYFKPESIYVDYLKGKENIAFELDKAEVIKLDNLDIVKTQHDWGSKQPAKAAAPSQDLGPELTPTGPNNL